VSSTKFFQWTTLWDKITKELAIAGSFLFVKHLFSLYFSKSTIIYI